MVDFTALNFANVGLSTLNNIKAYVQGLGAVGGSSNVGNFVPMIMAPVAQNLQAQLNWPTMTMPSQSAMIDRFSSIDWSGVGLNRPQVASRVEGVGGRINNLFSNLNNRSRNGRRGRVNGNGNGGS